MINKKDSIDQLGYDAARVDKIMAIIEKLKQLAPEAVTVSQP